MQKYIILFLCLNSILRLVHTQEVMESRSIDENALKKIIDLGLTTKPNTKPSVNPKPQQPSYAQQQKFSLQGEKQTQFTPFIPSNAYGPLGNIYNPFIPYPPALPTKPSGSLKEPTLQQLLQYLLTYVPPKPAQTYKPPTYPYPTFLPPQTVLPQTVLPQTPPPYGTYPTNPYQFAAPANSGRQLVLQAPASAYIIINPTNYPTYHYYAKQNDSAPRSLLRPGDIASDLAQADAAEVPTIVQNLSKSNTAAPVAEPAAAESLEQFEQMDPFFVTMPEGGLGDERNLPPGLLLEPSFERESGLSDPLLELLLKAEDGNKRRIQEHVAAIFLRNYNANRK